MLIRACSLGLRALLRTSAAPSLQHFSQFASRADVRVSEDPSTLPPHPGPVSHYGLAASAVTGKDVNLYTVSVVTGRRRGAGTNDPVAIQLIGTNGSSEKFLLDTHDHGFERGSHKLFTLPVPKDLGAIRRVHIEKQTPSGYDPSRGWYLRQLEIENHEGEKVLFPCNSWLGDSDCGVYKAPCERNLLPAATEMIQGHHEPVHVLAAGLSIPHPEKVMNSKLKGVNQQGFGYGGEDAYFYCEGKHRLFGMGVADGIYSWREQGIDSGMMSQQLMQWSLHMIQSGVEDVFKVLQSSSRRVLSEGVKGSCTASLLTINQVNGQLHAANLGDSGFMVMGRPHPQRGFSETSDLEVKFRTAQLEHEFGRPFQIGHHEHASRAEDADLVSFYVCRGDVIVMGSDGLFDNVNEGEITGAVNHLLAQGAGPSRMVQALVKAAFDASVDKSRETPYARDASEAFNMVYSGGKQDDITVLVALCK